MVQVSELEATLERMFRQIKSSGDYAIQSQLRSRGAVGVTSASIQSILNQQVMMFIGGATRVVSAAAIASMDEIVDQMIRGGATELSDAMQQFAYAARTRATRKVGLARVNELAANEAHRVVLRAYDNRVGNNAHPRYRAGQGRLVGRMRAALERPDIIYAFQDGVVFGNTAVLDTVAAHWRRLNFGAGNRGRQSRIPKGERIYQSAAFGDIDKIVSGTASRPAPLAAEGTLLRGMYLRWNSAGPSPAFSMPAGLWFVTGGGVVEFGDLGKKRDEFYPMGQALARLALTSSNSEQFRKRMTGFHAFLGSKGKKYPTEGIEGRQFFQPGLNALARLLPTGYLGLAQKWILEAADETHPRGPIAAARGLT